MKSLFCLHGFLGLSSDWDFLREHAIVVAPDLNKVVKKNKPFPSLERIRDILFIEAQQKLKNSKSRILVGYSMGGRIALEIFEKHSDFFDKLILISTGLGVPAEERDLRLKFDRDWGARFAAEDFNSVIKDWNSLPVFSGSRNEPDRIARNYDPHVLQHMIADWSQALQKYRWDQLDKYKKPVQYIVGGNDLRYVQFANQVRGLNTQTQVEVLHGSGHRVLFDSPKELIRILTS